MEISPATLTSLSALVIALIAVVWGVIHMTGVTDLREEITAIKTAQAATEVKVSLIWVLIQSRVGSLVKAPTHERLDELVDQFADHVMTLPELQELQELLGLRAKDKTLMPIQADAIALALMFVADRLAAKHVTEGGESQESIEQRQVRDKERKPEDLIKSHE